MILIHDSEITNKVHSLLRKVVIGREIRVSLKIEEKIFSVGKYCLFPLNI